MAESVTEGITVKPESVTSSPTEVAGAHAGVNKNVSLNTEHSDDISSAQGRNWLFLGTMGVSLVLVVAFFAASYGQLSFLHQRILGEGNQDLMDAIMASLPESDVPESERLAAREQTLQANHQQALIGLEILALERRHHQANVLLMSRVWVQYMGFIIGMLLALIGSAFVLGKLREPPFEADVAFGFTKFLLSGASPGMFLVSLGTILMIITIVINHTITVVDRPLFVFDQGVGIPSSVAEVDQIEPVLTDPFSNLPDTGDKSSKENE